MSTILTLEQGFSLQHTGKWLSIFYWKTFTEEEITDLEQQGSNLGPENLCFNFNILMIIFHYNWLSW